MSADLQVSISAFDDIALRDEENGTENIMYTELYDVQFEGEKLWIEVTSDSNFPTYAEFLSSGNFSDLHVNLQFFGSGLL
jgi:hypothetical protein